MKRCILLNENDTVATLLAPAVPGEEFVITDAAGKECGKVTVLDEVPFAHKVAIKEMPEGSKVVKMNTTIGLAGCNIAIGNYAHVHNIMSIEGRRAVK